MHREVERRNDYRAGIIAAEIYNCNRTSKTQRARSPFDYFETREPAPAIRSAQQIYNTLDSAFKRIHGKPR